MPTIKRKERPPTEWVKKSPEPLIAWGPSLFAPRDEFDGTRVGGYRLVCTPDGSLVGIQEPKENR